MSEELNPHAHPAEEAKHEAADSAAQPQGAMQPPKKNMMKMFAVGGAIAVVAALLVANGVMAYGVYKLKWHGATTMAYLKVVPLPVAYVNSDPIKYQTYLEDLAAINKYQAATQGGFPQGANLEDLAIQRLIRNTILEQEANKRHITVTQAEIDKEFDGLGQGASAADVAKQLHDLYGWDVATAKEKLVRPYLLETKLSDALAKQPDIDKTAQDKANEVLTKLKAGGDFAALAKQYSDDTGSAQQGGELGWFEKGKMVPEFETAAFALKPNQISGLVKTQYGYHIIQVEQVKYAAGAISQVRARHILIQPLSVETYLDQLVASAKIKKFN